MWWFYDPCFCTHSKAEIMRIILGFYRPQNALEKVKLWPFESWLRFSYFSVTFSCHPFSAYPLEHTRPTFEKKISQTVYSCTRYRSSLVTVWLIFFLTSGGCVKYAAVIGPRPIHKQIINYWLTDNWMTGLAHLPIWTVIQSDLNEIEL